MTFSSIRILSLLEDYYLFSRLDRGLSSIKSDFRRNGRLDGLNMVLS